MRLCFTERFLKLYQKLPHEIRRRADKQMQLLLENPRHPSLRFHKMKGSTSYWEIRITMHYRIVFQINGDKYVLTAIGSHDILDKR